MLCGAEGVPDLAVLVAYEHHLRWDNRPSYPLCERQPNLASQITAVADTWDAMASETGETARLARAGAARLARAFGYLPRPVPGRQLSAVDVRGRRRPGSVMPRSRLLEEVAERAEAGSGVLAAALGLEVAVSRREGE